ncbi:PAS domain S-box protein [Sulfurimonas sp.]|uniref:PAS domain S-box protein n=1 Tax=Sulfurimonas sp. TaxID=2022749 RepID=UPI0035659A4A
MRLLNLKYQNIDELRVFLDKYMVKDSNSVLIQVYSSHKNSGDLSKVKSELKSLLPSTSIIATSTAGIVSDGKILDDEIIISFSIFEKSIVKSKSFLNMSTTEILDKLYSEVITDKTKLLICYGNTFKIDSEALIKAITTKFPNIKIAGGNSADDFKFENCSIFSDLCSNSCNECDIAFAAIDSDVLKVETKYLLNWQTIGKELTVTKSDGSRVYEINNKNISDIYEHYLGREIRDEILSKGIEFPLICEENGVEVARAPVGVNDDGSIVFAGDLLDGTKVKFGYANIGFIEDYNHKNLLDEFEHKSEAVYIYTCAARRSMLDKYLDDEVSIINEVGPTSGFVTYGEYFHDAKSCSNHLLNITTTYVLLNESEENKEPINKSSYHTKEKDSKDMTLKALTTLVSRTSEELDQNIYYLEQFQKAVDEVAVTSITDEKGIITHVNKNFANISGYTEDELIGKPHNIVRHEDMPKEAFKDMWDTIQSGKIWKGLVKNKRKDGKPYHVLSEISPIYNKDGSFKEYVGIRNDVTELEEYKQILKNELDTTSQNLEDSINYARQYEHAINTTTAILKTDTNNIIKYANEKFCELSGYTLDELIGRDCSELRHERHRREKKCEYIQKQLAKGKIVQETLTNISKNDKEYTINNLFYPVKDLDNNVVEHLQIMYDITEILDLNQEIVDTQKEVVQTMGAIGETRSKETGLHVRRVAKYSYLLAKLAGLSEEDASLLKQGSPMHDIGKVGIPDNILNKPGKLTYEEFEIMKTHAEIGYEMLKHSERPILKASATIALTHHEKYNGKGYPKGLSGADIHIFGRITAIADVFDALGHDRVYKKAWPLEDILELFKKERGEHFDPNLVDLFFDNLDQFLEIRDKMQDHLVDKL